MRWYRVNKNRFLVPLSFQERSDQFLNWHFLGIDRVVTGFLGRHEITVPVEWGGECWDLLVSLDVMPTKQGQNHICGFCLPEHQIPYPDRASLWKDHLFEPFLTWVNNTLAPAKWLRLEGSLDKGYTSASLLQNLPDDKKDSDVMTLPLAEIQKKG
jgi:hypothetical protein